MAYVAVVSRRNCTVDANRLTLIARYTPPPLWWERRKEEQEEETDKRTAISLLIHRKNDTYIFAGNINRYN
jgi:hypothetical protein